jgi:hypothetical protein
MTIPVSLLLGFVAGIVLALAVRGLEGRRRIRRGVAVSLPILIALTAWAFWRDSFPPTFGPFTFTVLLTSAGERDTKPPA